MNDQWLKNMEYLEAYDDAHAELDESEAEEINRKLDILDRDRMARENGEKPAGRWTREDFKDLLHAYPQLRGLRTQELRALFLGCTGSIDEVIYCKRLSMEEVREARAQGGHPFYTLATCTLANRNLDELEEEGYRYAFQWSETEERKLWRIWRNL